MSYALFIAPPGAGKSTSYLGDEEAEIRGLSPENTLVFVASEKPTHMRHSLAYTPMPIERITPQMLQKGKPLPFNYITLNSGNVDLKTIKLLIESAKMHGIMSRVHKKAFPLLNVVIDDFQDFINNIFYNGATGKGYAKFDNVHTVPRLLLSYIKGIVNAQHAKGNILPENRVDFFMFMHVTPTNPSLPVDDTNPLKWKLVGKVLENAYPLDGQFNNLILIDEFKFYGKPQLGAPLVRSESGVVEDGMPADLLLIKQNFNAIYKKVLDNVQK